jgi:hypothetical protein
VATSNPLRQLSYFFYLIGLLSGGLHPSLSHSNELIRPESIDELRLLNSEIKTDPLVRIPGAQVAYANYEALRRDFPVIAHKSEQEINQWILDNFAFISEEQLKLNGVRNSKIPADTQKKIAYRPPEYDRAAVLEATDNGKTIGLVDIKGIGLSPYVKSTELEMGHLSSADEMAETYTRIKDRPGFVDDLRTRDHSDGLMSLGEGIAETTRQTAVQRSFDIHNANAGDLSLQTIETYFNIQLPFEILKDEGKRIPAGLYGRQAHWGRRKPIKFRVTVYSDEFGGMQGTEQGASVDFGGVMIRESKLKQNFDFIPGTRAFNPQQSKPWAWGHEVATAFVGANDKGAVFRHIDEMLSPIHEDWLSARGNRSYQVLLQNTLATYDKLKIPVSPDEVTTIWNTLGKEPPQRVAAFLATKAHSDNIAWLVKSAPEEVKKILITQSKRFGFLKERTEVLQALVELKPATPGCLSPALGQILKP